MRTPFAGLALALVLPAAGQAQTDAERIAHALQAGPPEISHDATVRDFQGNVLREGTNGWVCYADPDNAMCADAVWQEYVDALVSQREPVIDRIGVAYMLLGDNGSSNTDPTATGPTDDNDWVVTGPHLMLVGPPGSLDGITDDYESGQPFIMWKNTPYAHVMVPIE